VRSHTSQIANISPGEPFHRRESSLEWLIDWYVVREKGIALFGPSPKSIIEPISKDEFIRSVKANAKAWRDENLDHDATFPETLGFVLFVISQFKKEAIKKAQELVNTYLPEERSLSDELTAERRMED
jgi:hypothetical protein